MGYEPEGARHAVWRRVAAQVLAGALGATACGNTDGNPDPQSLAGRNHGGAAAGVAGQPHTGGAGGAGGGLPPVAGAGGVPARHPLIGGDAACPAAAPAAPACTLPGVSCVYRGIASGLSETNEPMRCACNGGSWFCVTSAENGETSCPDGTVTAELPLHGEPCAVRGQSCLYALWAHNTLAGCNCPAGGETGEAGGAAGAENEQTSNWFCGV